MTRRSTRFLVAALASSAMLLSLSASAQAGWSAPGKNPGWPCGGYNKALSPLWFQECVIVSASGDYVQSLLAVSNTSSTSSIGVYGVTRTYRDGHTLVNTDCGYTVFAPGARKWCWGETRAIGSGRYVQGAGFVAYPGGPSFTAWSPTIPVGGS